MKRFLILILVIFLSVSNSANAREISVFAVNFSESNLSSLVGDEIERALQKTEAVIGVIDAEDARIAAYFSYNHSELGGEGAYRGIISEVSSRFGSSEKSINLPLVLSEVNDFILSHFQTGDVVRIYLVDTLEHQGRTFSFQNGFPNDGFLTLQDTDFLLVQPLPKEIDSEVSVVQLTQNQFPEQYLKFSFHLSKVILGGNLVSYSFANSAPPLSFDEPVAVDVPDLETVSASRVINGEVRPSCEMEDLVQVVQKADRLEVTIKNSSRSNSEGNFVLSVGESREEGRFSFNTEGQANFKVQRLPGEGTLRISDCEGVMKDHFSYDIGALDDVISVVGISEGVARITGENIQRVDGSDVIIVDEDTGRQWITQAADGLYSIDVPVAPGSHTFYVELPFSREKQYFEVFLQEKCTTRSELSYDGALGRLTVESTCKAHDNLFVSYNSESYSALFAADQSATVKFPLACGTIYGLWKVDNQPENEFIVQYTINPDQVEIEEGQSLVSITVTNLSRANSEAKYAINIGEEAFEGTVTFDADGSGKVELPRTLPGAGMFELEDCQGNMVRAGNFTVTQIDDDINVTVVSDQKARIFGENIQRPNGSLVRIKNEDTGEEWTATVEHGTYSLDVIASPGLQKFSVVKPFNDQKYLFDVKVRDECSVIDDIEFDSGLAVLNVNSDCQLDDEVVVHYNDRDYRRAFDNQGNAQFKLPMECGNFTGSWSVGDFRDSFETNLDCTGKLRVVLRWDASVDLDLHVSEGASANFQSGIGWAYFAKCLGPNDSDCKAAGFINKDCTASASSCGSPKEEYYQVEIADLPHSARSITAMVNNYTRDSSGTPSGQNCGEGENAQVSYTITAYIENERYERRGITEHHRRFRSVPCDVTRSQTAFMNENELTIPFR